MTKRSLPLLWLPGLLLLTSVLPAQKGQVATANLLVVESGKDIFPVDRCNGGDIVLELASAALGASPQTRTPTGTPKIEPLVLEGDPVGFLPWLAPFLAGQSTRLNFQVTRYGFDYKAASRLVVSDASISRVEFDTLDASTKDAFRVKVTLQPGRISEEAGDGSAPKLDNAKRKRLSANTFRITIPGVDTSRVATFGPIVVEAKLAQEATGRARESIATAGRGQPAPCSLRVAEAGAAEFVAWHRSFVVEGKRTEADRKPVTIELMSPDLKTVQLRFEAKAASILAARRETDAGNLPQRRVELLAEAWGIGL